MRQTRRKARQAEALKEDIISRLCAIRIPALRAEALSHTLGVCQSMALLAAARDLDPVLCMSMGLLHDCALYLQNCGHPGHARKSALLAETILQEHGFASADIERICTAISHDPYSEALKDADVLERWLTARDAPLSDARRMRMIAMCKELQLQP